MHFYQMNCCADKNGKMGNQTVPDEGLKHERQSHGLEVSSGLAYVMHNATDL